MIANLGRSPLQPEDVRDAIVSACLTKTCLLLWKPPHEGSDGDIDFVVIVDHVDREVYFELVRSMHDELHQIEFKSGSSICLYTEHDALATSRSSGEYTAHCVVFDQDSFSALPVSTRFVFSNYYEALITPAEGSLTELLAYEPKVLDSMLPIIADGLATVQQEIAVLKSGRHIARKWEFGEEAALLQKIEKRLNSPQEIRVLSRKLERRRAFWVRLAEICHLFDQRILDDP